MSGFLLYNRTKSAKRYDLAKTKSTESLAEYLFTHIVKHRVIILKEVAHVARKKGVPDFDHIFCPRFEHNKTRLPKMGIG